jgi:hypothetical protein
MFVATDQPLIVAVDDTLERRFGQQVGPRTQTPLPARVGLLGEPPLRTERPTG